MHEGDEYWIREQDQEIGNEDMFNAVKMNSHCSIVVCPGPYESRNCSNSVIIAAAQPHLM